MTGKKRPCLDGAKTTETGQSRIRVCRTDSEGGAACSRSLRLAPWGYCPSPRWEMTARARRWSCKHTRTQVRAKRRTG